MESHASNSLGIRFIWPLRVARSWDGSELGNSANARSSTSWNCFSLTSQSAARVRTAQLPLEFEKYREGERRHLERLNRVRRERSSSDFSRTLNELRRAAQATENLMPYILDAVRAYATLGEICDVFREVFGIYRPVEAL